MHVAIASCEVSNSSVAVVNSGSREASWMKLKSSCHVSSTQLKSQSITSNPMKYNRMVTKAISESSDINPLPGKRAFIAGIADDNGYGWAIAKSLAAAGAEILVGTWVPASI